MWEIANIMLTQNLYLKKISIIAPNGNLTKTGCAQETINQSMDQQCEWWVFFYTKFTFILIRKERKLLKKNSDVIKIREEEKRNRKETLHPLKKWIIHHFYDVTCWYFEQLSSLTLTITLLNTWGWRRCLILPPPHTLLKKKM